MSRRQLPIGSQEFPTLFLPKFSGVWQLLMIGRSCRFGWISMIFRTPHAVVGAFSAHQTARDGQIQIPAYAPITTKLAWETLDDKPMFSMRHGTILADTRIPYRKWAIAIYLYSTNLKGISSMKMHWELGISQKSTWFTLQRLRKAT